MEAVYEGKDMFVWLATSSGNKICYQTLPFVLDHKLGPIGSGKGSPVVVISPMVPLIVDLVQNCQI